MQANEPTAYSYRVLTDADVERSLTMDAAVGAMEGAFLEMAQGTLVAPPRFSLDSPDGSLVFTPGAATGSAHSIGFRVYDTFAHPGTAHRPPQLVAVFDSRDGTFEGLVIGSLIGAWRTGAIGGVAIKHMARLGASRLTVIGAGFQARTQVAAAFAVRAFRQVIVCGRTAEHAERFRAEIAARYGVETRACDSVEGAVAGADVVLCATTSTSPVLEHGWLRPGTHVSTIGPKTADAHELPGDIAKICSVIATDSPEQLTHYGHPYFIEDVARIAGLADIVAGRVPGRRSDADVTLFCSVGLAGTEVVLARALLDRVQGTLPAT